MDVYGAFADRSTAGRFRMWRDRPVMDRIPSGYSTTTIEFSPPKPSSVVLPFAGSGIQFEPSTRNLYW